MIPKIGSEVTVKYKNPMWEARDRYFFLVPEFQTFSGVVYPVQSHQASRNVLNLATGHSSWKFRELLLENVVSIDGVNREAATSKALRVWQVRGSKGMNYTVVESNGKLSCDCIGFKYHDKCRHLKEAA